MSGPGFTAGDRSRPSSTIVASTASHSRDLKIDGYEAIKGIPTGSAFTASSFAVGGRQWHVDYYPNGNDVESAEYISVFLVREDGHADPVMVRFGVSLLDRAGEPVRAYSKTTEYHQAPGDGWGFPFFVKRSYLERSKHLKDDNFSIRYDISVVTEYRAEDPAAPSLVIPPPDWPRHFSDLLLHAEGADVTFLVGGETFMAHRCILAARSPVFRAELLGTMKEADPANHVKIDDMRADVFKNLLHFVYTDSLPAVEDQEEVPMFQHLLVAADRYDLKRLKILCEVSLCRHMAVSMVATTLVLADQHHCHWLKDECIRFIESPEISDAEIKIVDFHFLAKTCPSLTAELLSRRRAR